MKKNQSGSLIRTMVVVLLFLVTLGIPSSAEIMNDNEFGTLEIIDFSVIEEAAGMFGPVGLSFNVSRGGPLYPGEEIMISYQGQHDRYVSILDYSPDRIVKPLVMNVRTRLTDGGLGREYWGIVGGALGREYILMVITALPLTDSALEQIALAPNEIELDDQILSVAVNDFTVVAPGRNPNEVVEWGADVHGGPVGAEFIPLDEFAEFIDYPLNTYPYNPWPYMYLYPYARFHPTVYVEQYGPFSRNWYVYPIGTALENNFWNYTHSGWIEDGRWFIPPGGYWEGSLRLDDPYNAYWLRILPYLIRENTSYLSLQIEINGTLIQSSIDFSSAIGYGEYWTSNPFAYYNMANLLHYGDNTIRLYWPEYMQEPIELQMMDMVPAELAEGEIEEAHTATGSLEITTEL